MKLAMTFGEYLSAMTGQAHEAMALTSILKPFAVKCSGTTDHNLVIGFLLDVLAEDYQHNDVIDCMDVVLAASDLGYEGAEQFIDQAENIFSSHILT